MRRLQLHSDSSLPCPQRVLVTAAEKGIDLEIIHTDVFAGENKVNSAIHSVRLVSHTNQTSYLSSSNDNLSPRFLSWLTRLMAPSSFSTNPAQSAVTLLPFQMEPLSWYRIALI